MNIVVKPAYPCDAECVARLMGELLQEIMDTLDSHCLNPLRV